MNTPYDWVCSACGTANLAGSEPCQKCGCPAVTSAADIERRISGPVAAPIEAKESLRLTGPKNVIASVLLVVVLAGVVLERVTVPTMSLWWVALAMMIGGALPLFAMLKSEKARRQQTSSQNNEAQPGSQQDAAR
jgi:hypothetical protein